MACQTNAIAAAATAALTFFKIIPQELEAAGTLTQSQATAITNYTGTASNLLTETIAEAESGDTTLEKVAADIQAFVTGYDSVAAGLPPQLTLTINLANAGLQSVLSAIELETAKAA